MGGSLIALSAARCARIPSPVTRERGRGEGVSQGRGPRSALRRSVLR
jgi:hypothetical protein